PPTLQEEGEESFRNLTLSWQTKYIQNNPVLYLTLTGSLDTVSVGKVDKKLTQLIQKGFQYLVLDFKKIHYINSTGMGTLVKISDMLRENQGNLAIVKIPTKIRDLLEMLGLDKALTMCESEEEAYQNFFGQIALDSAPETSPATTEIGMASPPTSSELSTAHPKPSSPPPPAEESITTNVYANAAPESSSSQDTSTEASPPPPEPSPEPLDEEMVAQPEPLDTSISQAPTEEISISEVKEVMEQIKTHKDEKEAEPTPPPALEEESVEEKINMLTEDLKSELADLENEMETIAAEVQQQENSSSMPTEDLQSDLADLASDLEFLTSETPENEPTKQVEELLSKELDEIVSSPQIEEEKKEITAHLQEELDQLVGENTPSNELPTPLSDVPPAQKEMDKQLPSELDTSIAEAPTSISPPLEQPAVHKMEEQDLTSPSLPTSNANAITVSQETTPTTPQETPTLPFLEELPHSAADTIAEKSPSLPAETVIEASPHARASSSPSLPPEADTVLEVSEETRQKILEASADFIQNPTAPSEAIPTGEKTTFASTPVPAESLEELSLSTPTTKKSGILSFLFWSFFFLLLGAGLGIGAFFLPQMFPQYFPQIQSPTSKKILEQRKQFQQEIDQLFLPELEELQNE
ncbi:MAG: STAS domain-containing protein, partial [Planctomycetota bacterium]